MTITIYQKPACTTCRRVYHLLQESGVDFNEVNYFIEPITKSMLKDLLRKLGMLPRELLREKEPIYKELRLEERKCSDEELIGLMIEYPQLIQRPIIEKGEKAILARPPERLREIL